MKRAKSMFKVKMKEGGFLSGSPSGAMTSAIGMGSSLLGNLFTPKEKPLDDVHDEYYHNQVDKANSTGNTISSFSDAAIASGNPYAMAAGAIGKGIAPLFGAEGRDKAEQDAKLRSFNRNLSVTDSNGAKNINTLPKFTAPAYGRQGLKLGMPNSLKMKRGSLKFKTKFGAC